MEFADHLPSCVGFEVLEHHVVDHQSWLLFASHIQMDPSRDLLNGSRLNLNWLFFRCKLVEFFVLVGVADAFLLVHYASFLDYRLLRWSKTAKSSSLFINDAAIYARENQKKMKGITRMVIF